MSRTPEAVFADWAGLEVWAGDVGSQGFARVGLWGAIDGDLNGPIDVGRVTELEIGGAIDAPVHAGESIWKLRAFSIQDDGRVTSDGGLRELNLVEIPPAGTGPAIDVAGDIGQIGIGTNVSRAIGCGGDVGLIEIGGDLLGNVTVDGFMDVLLVDGNIGNPFVASPLLSFGTARVIDANSLAGNIFVEEQMSFLCIRRDIIGSVLVGSIDSQSQIGRRQGIECDGTLNGNITVLSGCANAEIDIGELSASSCVDIYGDLGIDGKVRIDVLYGQLNVWGNTLEDSSLLFRDVCGIVRVGGAMDGYVRFSGADLLGQVVFGAISTSIDAWGGDVEIDGTAISSGSDAPNKAPFYDVLPGVFGGVASIDESTKRSGGAIGVLPFRAHGQASTPEYGSFVPLDGPTDTISEVIIDHYGPVFVNRNHSGPVFQVEYMAEASNPPQWFDLSARYRLRDRLLIETEIDETRTLAIEPDPDYPGGQQGFGGSGVWRIRPNPGALLCTVLGSDPADVIYDANQKPIDPDLEGYFTFRVGESKGRGRAVARRGFQSLSNWLNEPTDIDGSGTIDARDLQAVFDAVR